MQKAYRTGDSREIDGSLVERGSRPSLRSRLSEDDAGFILPLSAVMLSVLLGIAGFSVDLGNWYLHVQRAQRAADAAALAGDVHMPANFDQARDIAREELLRNGVPLAVANAARANTNCATSPCIGKTSVNSQLEVRVTTTVQNSFIRLLGIANTQSFTRRAIADHAPTLEWSNDTNALGGPQPSGSLYGITHQQWTTPRKYDNYFLQVGPRTTKKVEGDRFGSDNCLENIPNTDYNPMNCPGPSNNLDYNTSDPNRSYIFKVTVQPDPSIPSPRNLLLQGYDVEYNPGVDAFCATDGTDLHCPSDEGDMTPSTWTTRFTRITSATNMAAHPSNNCNSFGFVSPQAPRWRNVCGPISVNTSTGAVIYIRVDTVGTGSNLELNHFMMRAGLSAGVGPNITATDITQSRNSVKLTAIRNFPVFTQASLHDGDTASHAHLPVAQINSQWAGRTIHLQFWDIGDYFQATDATPGAFVLRGSVTPTPTKVSAALTNNCYASPPNGPVTNLTPATMWNGCGLAITRDKYNGQLIHMEWRVPQSFTCEPALEDCWLFVAMQMPVNVSDDTTWTINEPGAPIRLVK